MIGDPSEQAESRWAYRPGSWFGVFGSATTLLLPGSEKERVGALWSSIDDGAGFDDVLDTLLASGLGVLPGFVLVSTGDGPTKILVRGASVRATIGTPSGEVELDGASVTTWVERTLPEVTSLVIGLDPTEPGAEGDAEATMTIEGGLVRVGHVAHPPQAEPDAVEDEEPEASESAAVMAAEGAGDAEEAEDAGAAEEAEDAGDAVEPEAVDAGAGDAGAGEPDAMDEIPEATLAPTIDPPPFLADEQGSEPVTEVLELSPLDEDDTPPPPPPMPPAPPAPPAWPKDGPDGAEGSMSEQPSMPPPFPPAPIPPAPPAWPGDDVAPPTAFTPGAPAPEAPEPPGPESFGPESSGPEPVDETEHDGLTQMGVNPEEFVRPQPGIEGQPMAPSVTAAPVAKLVISNGDTVDVDRVILIGRAPEARRFTSTDQPRLVTVPSPLHEISSTHVEVRPGSGADHGSAVVTDMGSTNGTVLVQPGLPPEELKPGIAVQLIPGATINLGDGVTIQVARP